MKKFREQHTIHYSRRKEFPEYNIPVLITYAKYGDNGKYYEQETRYAKESEISELNLIKCEDCKKYMDGGKWDGKKHRCYICAREHLLKEILDKI